MVPQQLSYCSDSGSEPLGRFGLVFRHVIVDLLESPERPPRPDDLYCHNSLSSWARPQAHFGRGSSLSVPQESNQAFMSSCLT